MVVAAVAAATSCIKRVRFVCERAIHRRFVDTERKVFGAATAAVSVWAPRD